MSWEGNSHEEECLGQWKGLGTCPHSDYYTIKEMLSTFRTLKTKVNVNTIYHVSKLIKMIIYYKNLELALLYPTNYNFMMPSIKVVLDTVYWSFWIFLFLLGKTNFFFNVSISVCDAHTDTLLWKPESAILNIAWVMILNELRWSFQ